MVNFKFTASAVGAIAKGFLFNGKPLTNQRQQAQLTTYNLTSPLTDKSVWQDRYVLCEMTFRRADGRTMVMNDVVCAISRAKNIVTTSMIGRDGTVKEYINDGDWQVNILVGVVAIRDGEIVDEYPAEGLKVLRSFLDTKEAISVHSSFLDVFDINKLVIKSYSVQQDTASNYQTVSVQAMSDDDYYIYSAEY